MKSETLMLTNLFLPLCYIYTSFTSKLGKVSFIQALLINWLNGRSKIIKIKNEKNYNLLKHLLSSDNWSHESQQFILNKCSYRYHNNNAMMIIIMAIIISVNNT